MGIQLMVDGQEATSTANTAANVVCENGNSVEHEISSINQDLVDLEEKTENYFVAANYACPDNGDANLNFVNIFKECIARIYWQSNFSSGSSYVVVNGVRYNSPSQGSGVLSHTDVDLQEGYNHITATSNSSDGWIMVQMLYKL